jgi:hypothetical protein
MKILDLEGYQRTLLKVRELGRQPHELAARLGITLKEATLQLMQQQKEKQCDSESTTEPNT